MRDLSVLNPRELRALRDLHAAYCAAKSAKNYAASDALRTRLYQYGCVPPAYDTWSSVHESSDHRVARAASRYTHGED